MCIRDRAYRVWWTVTQAVGSNREWPPLSSSQQKEMNGAIVMAQEAMDQVSGAHSLASFTRSLVCTTPSTQGHIEAAGLTGCIYNWGHGVAVDYDRALAAYKIGAEGGDAVCQYSLGFMLEHGRGIDSPDHKQALVWLEKAAAQDDASSLAQLSVMAHAGRGQQPSWRRARELLQRAAALGNEQATQSLLVAQSLSLIHI